MKLFKKNELSPLELERLLVRSTHSAAEALDAVRSVLGSVRAGGDRAVQRWTTRFDGLEAKPLVLSARDIAARAAKVPGELIAAIETAASNIEDYHRSQQRREPVMEKQPGIRLWREPRPIERVGLYVPGGTAPLPSTALMLAIPARVAGCPEIYLATPPGADGGPSPVVCAAARVAGLEMIYCAGGAQAIAAMAYGTRSLPIVDKIFGPGNRYVAAAKQIVSVEPGGPAIDLLAGPSELTVLASESARAHWIAADLIAQAEHDEDAVVTLITDSETLVEKVRVNLAQQLTNLPRSTIAGKALHKGVALLVANLEEGVDLVNRMAPEHLSLQVEEPGELLPRIRAAGAVFVGAWTPEAAGDYATGANHTLPTSRAARHTSGLALDAFQRWISFQELTREGLEGLAPTIERLARAEELEGHARSVTKRLEEE